VDILNPVALSLCPAEKTPEGWRFAADPTAKYEVKAYTADGHTASATLSCTYGDHTVILTYTVSAEGVNITQSGDGEQCHTLPVLAFDGETHPAVTVESSSVTVAYEGHTCRYTVNGGITDTGITAANRNGRYRALCASACGQLSIHIEII
jgi:hypothetical protein